MLFLSLSSLFNFINNYKSFHLIRIHCGKHAVYIFSIMFAEVQINFLTPDFIDYGSEIYEEI